MPRGKTKKRGYLIYLVALCFLAGALSALFPTFGERIGSAETVLFNPLATIIGGESAAVSNGVYYGFTLVLNIPLVVFIMLEITGVFASLSARNSPRMIGAVLVFEIIILAGLIFSRTIFLAVNTSLLGGNLVFGPGFYGSLAACLIGFFFALIELILCTRFWKKRDEFR